MTTATPPDVAQAEADATTAEQAAEALAERVREGDEQVTAEQLATAQQAGMFARLRADAARRKADREAAAAEEKHRAELTAQAVAVINRKGSRAPIAAAYEQALAALTALASAVDQHNQAVTEAARLLRAADAPEQRKDGDKAPTVSVDFWGVPSVSIAPGTAHRPVGAGPVLAVLFAKAAAGEVGKMGPGESRLTAAPLADHARRHESWVRALLARAGGEAK